MSLAKTAADESFPVASRLLAPAVRPAVLVFYRFARAADDIADAPALSAGEKLRRLAALEAGLLDPSPSQPLTAALVAVDRVHRTGVAEALLLLAAFRQDAVRSRYAAWDELLAYCRLSAEPVGRFLLRLHGEGPAAEPAADALCSALQLLNHLQDLATDRDRLDRVYLPRPWLDAAGGEARFFAPAATAARRPVIDAALDQIDGLLAVARPLPGQIRDRRLALQATATIACAQLLSTRLRRADPVARRVGIGSVDKLLLASRTLRGHRQTPDAAWTRRVVDRSGSSFRLGIRCLNGDRRRALDAVYAFCRTVDDIADGAAPAAERQLFLRRWRDELTVLGNAPRTPVGRELAWACDRFALPEDELHRLLDGMKLDAADRVRLPDEPALEHYWRSVAGSVGVLSVRIFGATDADTFALSLARALQYVNILRDVDEDAARDRVYLPRARLAALGVPDASAETMIGHSSFAAAWARLADEAEAAFDEAEKLLALHDRRPLRPAVVMMHSYRPLLLKLKKRGWKRHAPRTRLSRRDKLRLAFRAMAGAT